MIAMLLPLIAAAAGPGPVRPDAIRPRPLAVDSSRHPAGVAIRVDDRHHRLFVTVGPFKVPPTGMAMHGMEMDMASMAQSESLVTTFRWPADRLFHAVQLAVVDGNGDLLPRRLLHHTYMVNFDRRMLLYPLTERSFSFGEETADLLLPATVGVPMKAGYEMGVIIMWNNETGHEVDDAYVRYTFQINPRHQWPRPTLVMPFLADEHLVVAGFDTFSVAPGGRTMTTDFTVPINGRLFAAGAHLHDHALRMSIVDPRTGRTLISVHAIRDSTGHTNGVSRALPGLFGGGPHLRPGRTYRLVTTYDNPTGDTLTGAMALLGGLFVPDRMKDWPKLDRNSPDTQADVDQIFGRTHRIALSTH